MSNYTGIIFCYFPKPCLYVGNKTSHTDETFGIVDGVSAESDANDRKPFLSI